jgi:hypothetical protein
MLLAVPPPADPVTGLDIATLVIAVVGAITGVGSLVWNVASHALTGARVKAELQPGFFGHGGVITTNWDNFRQDDPPDPGFDRAVLVVKARNVGRLPASVTGWSVVIGATELSHVGGAWNKPLPHRLEGGEDNSWYVEFGQVEAIIRTLVATNMPPDKLAAKVSLGDGRTIRSRVVPLDGRQ